MSAAAREMTAGRAAEAGLLLKLTETLKGHFERGEWGVAAALELERRKVVERVFDGAPDASDLPLLTATLREVVRLNDELIGLAEHRRRALGRELDLISVGREASRAYGDVGRSQGSPRP